MKYDTSPLSLDTSGADTDPSEQELRFVPDDADGSNDRDTRFGEISHPTLVAQKSIGFDTFIEPRPQTKRLDEIKEKLGLPKYRSWALTALLASISAFGGGFAVYWVSAERPAPIVSSPPLTAAPVTEVQRTESFVSRQAAASASEEPLIPQTREIAKQKDRTVTGSTTRAGEPAATEQTETETTLGASSDATEIAPAATVVEQPIPQQPEQEAKVGAYVAEKSSGKSPLARCADGTYSYSSSRSAACAGRGGIGEWLGGGKPVPNTPAKQAAYVLGPRGGCYYLGSSSKKIYVEKKFCQQ